MKRWIAGIVGIALLAGCAGGTGNRLVPSADSAASFHQAAALGTTRQKKLSVRVTMRIPKRHRRERTPIHPATISPLTQSVGIAVNGGAPTVFNATPASPNCSIGPSGTTCTFAVTAPPGNDTFAVTTYSAASGGGTPLNSGSAVVAIATGKANAPHITLGPVVSSTSDTGIGSLRYAIASANPGDTILFMLGSGSTLTIGSPLTLNTSVSIAGPGVTTSIRMHRHRRHRGLHSNLSFSGVTIDGGGTQQIFVVKAGVTATISGLILANGLATTPNQPGGAIYNEGNLTLASDAFQDNGSQVDSPYVHVRHHVERARHKHGRRARLMPAVLHPHACQNYYAGAVYNHGIMTIAGTSFDSNVLQTTFSCGNTGGGAIYNDQYGTLTSSGNTYSNNVAYYGGAVYNDSLYGSATFDGDTFTGNSGCTAATGCAVTGCTGSGCTAYPFGEGGAIYDSSGPGVTVTNSTFTSNVAGGVASASAGYGGALYLNTGSPSITGSTFSGNLAGGGTSNCSYGYGGAVYENASNTVELDNDTFTNNSAGGDDHAYGGAVYNNANKDNGSGDTFTGNQAYATGSACQSQGNAAGGALYADWGASLSSSTFSNNSTAANYSAYAGAVYENDSTQLTGDTFTSNSTTGTGGNGAPHAYASGGAVYADCCLRLTGNTFTANAAATQSVVASDAAGGAVLANSYLTTSGNTFASNTLTSPSGGGYLRGAAIAAGGPSWSSNGDTFKSNAVTVGYGIYGGAVYVSAPFSINGATFDSNSGSGESAFSYGGAIYLDTAGTIANSSFTNNVADVSGGNGSGGAIYDNGGATLNALKVTGNSTSVAGGGLYVNIADSVNGSTFSANSVTNAPDGGGGGAIFTADNTTVSDSTISENTVVASAIHSGGGGIYDNNGLNLTGSTVSGNSVTGSGSESGGGGVYVNYTTGSIVNSTITDNTTTLNGGGVYTLTTPLSLTNVTLFANSATANGGNIEDEGSAMVVANTIVAGGTAGTGADIDTDNPITSHGYNIVGKPVTGSGTFTPATGDQIGTNVSPIDPKLGALSNNGGPTFTMADTATSPGKAAVPFSGGNCGPGGTGVTVDQRNFSRGSGGFCDIGAYEFGGSPSALRLHVPATSRGHRHRAKAGPARR